MTLKVNEIFYSIQGESSYAGRPCVFVRLTGCNLRCRYCDTTYAFHEGTEMEISDILKKIEAFDCGLVEITGGEPLIQKHTPDLIHELLEQDYQLLLETNGSLDTGGIDDRCAKIIDVKCPSSNEHHKNNLENLRILTPLDEIKFVIGTQEDYEFSKGILKAISGDRANQNKVHFSPVHGKISPEKLAGWILKDHLDVSLSLQIHKIIWPPEQRGV